MQNWGAPSATQLQRWINQDTISPLYKGFNIGTYWPIDYVTFDGYDKGPPAFTSLNLRSTGTADLESRSGLPAFRATAPMGRLFRANTAITLITSTDTST
jgi:hypothetical protein